jgi:regulatory protein
MSGTITAIRVQKKNPRRASLYLDGKFAMGLGIEVVQDFGLHRGQVLSDADLEALRRAEQQRRACQDVLRLLNYRPRSTAEVRSRLRDRGYDEAQVAAAVARFQELGLLDDRAFARAWVQDRQDLRPRGRQGLAAELRRKGLAPEVIAETLDEAVDDEGEAAQALALARARARSLAGLERPAFFRRLQGFLARRGFASEVVAQVVRQVWAQVSGQDADQEPGP